MEINKFKKLIVDKRVEERTLEGFWNVVKYLRMDTSDELGDILNNINDCDFELEIKKVSLAIIYNYSEFIEAELSIHFKEDYIGYYIMAFTLAGEVEDDRIKFENYGFIRKLIAIEERNEEIASLAIEENLEDIIIQRITGLSLERINEIKSEKK